jgi:GT2 family glycosyltransferase
VATVDVLIPTFNRRESLIFTLSGVVLQTLTDLRVIVADQSDEPVGQSPVIQSLRRIVEIRGGSLEVHHRGPPRGIAEQRDFLLRQSSADTVLYLDDDILMESWVVDRLYRVLREQGCGFVGAFPTGISYTDDYRPLDEAVDFWEGPVRPEVVNPGSPAWQRARFHTAANAHHVSQRLPLGETRLYKVAWLGACVIYDRAKLLEVGGFSFWSRLPRYHAGEEVLVQNLLMRRWGAAGILPSGTYFSEVPTTVFDSTGRIEQHALSLLPEMIERYAPGTEMPPEDAWKYW